MNGKSACPCKTKSTNERSNERSNERNKCARCTKPNTCTHLLSLRQQQLEKDSSTRLLHMVTNYKDKYSKDDIFYDCLSTDNDSGCKSKKSGATKSDSSRFDDKAAFCAALERVIQRAPMMLKELEQCRTSCNATLEITARLISDSKDNNPNCRYQGKPVTMKMPLEFDPNTGQMATKSAPTSSRHICEKPCSQHSEETHPGRVLTQQPPPVVTDVESDSYVGSCTPTIESGSREKVVPMPIPGYPPTEVDSDSQTEEEEYPEEEYTEQYAKEYPQESPQEYPQKYPQESKQEMRQRPEDVESYVESDVVEDSPLPRTPILSGRYYMALPQHKDFSNCSPCRYSPSPLMDEDGNVFCPGNCGCCQCAWKRRSFEDNRGHSNVKVCRCVQRGTIFTSFADRETCSQASYFDFCPCREKAEAKFLELYNCEMWSSENATRGAEVFLDQIKELAVPPQPRSS